jgi:hypothetical protein
LPIPGPVTILLTYLLAGSLLFYLVTAIYSFYRPGLRELPGPPLAAFSRLWNVFNIAHGNAPQKFRKLHQRYGKIVRIGPNHVSIADPATIPVIYGINSSHLKVSYMAFVTALYAFEKWSGNRNNSPSFMRLLIRRTKASPCQACSQPEYRRNIRGSNRLLPINSP